MHMLPGGQDEVLRDVIVFRARIGRDGTESHGKGSVCPVSMGRAILSRFISCRRDMFANILSHTQVFSATVIPLLIPASTVPGALDTLQSVSIYRPIPSLILAIICPIPLPPGGKP